MARFLAIAVLVIVAAGVTDAGGAKDKELKIQGKFTKDDPRDKQLNGAAQMHTFAMKAGKVYTIDMISTDVDSYLRLLDKDGNELAQDDDSGGMLNAQIVFNCTKDGEYKIVSTNLGGKFAGAYTLTAKVSGTAAQVSTAHAKMVGKEAPDFAADFAVNGKAVKLSEFQGKAVLLHFWEVRSAGSVAYLPKLSEWNKMYKAKGLVVVGVTFYTSDIGQKLAFDEETGGVKTVKAADKKADQATLTALAAHHKASHLLLTLPKQAALDAFDAYSVNGLPQVVLIDRTGMVRFIDIGGEKSSAAVEAQIKKLLEDK